MTASFNSHALSEDLFDFGNGSDSSSEQLRSNNSGRISKGGILVNENSSSSQSPDFAQSYGETQLEIFHHRHGLLILHLLAALMFGPSFVAWLQVCMYGAFFSILVWIDMDISVTIVFCMRPQHYRMRCGYFLCEPKITKLPSLL